LTGSSDAPPIAGRSPSYIVRQLHDFKTGARNGSLTSQMQPVVAALGSSEMLAISAYLASLPRTSGADQSLRSLTGPEGEGVGVHCAIFGKP